VVFVGGVEGIRLIGFGLDLTTAMQKVPQAIMLSTNFFEPPPLSSTFFFTTTLDDWKENDKNKR